MQEGNVCAVAAAQRREASGGFVSMCAAEECESQGTNITLGTATPWAAGGLAWDAGVAESIALQ